jgi:hypothetical protein
VFLILRFLGHLSLPLACIGASKAGVAGGVEA